MKVTEARPSEFKVQGNTLTYRLGTPDTAQVGQASVCLIRKVTFCQWVTTSVGGV